MGINSIILCLYSMNGFHLKGVSQDKGNIFPCTQISQPVPGKDTFNSNNDVFSVFGNRFKKDFRLCPDIPLQLYPSLLVKNAYIHRLCMKINTTEKFVLFGVKSYKASF